MYLAQNPDQMVMFAIYVKIKMTLFDIYHLNVQKCIPFEMFLLSRRLLQLISHGHVIKHSPFFHLHVNIKRLLPYMFQRYSAIFRRQMC
jgi:hypothetical protein